MSRTVPPDARDRRPWFSSLAARLLAVVVLAAIPAAVLLVGAGLEQRRAAIHDAEEDALRVARLAARDHEHLIDGATQLLTMLAHSVEVLGRDGSRCSALAAGTRRALPAYGNIGAATPDGTIFCSGVPFDRIVTIADREYFRRALATRAVVTSDPIVGRISGRLSVAVAAPAVRPDGTIAAVAFVALDLSSLEQVLARAALPSGSRGVLLDATGGIVVRVPSIANAPPAAGWAVARAARTHTEATVTAPGLDGVECLWSVVPVRGPGGVTMSVAVGLPRSAALAAANATLAKQLGAVAFTIALSTLVVWLAGNAFIRRQVHALIAAARRLGSGERGTRTNLPYDGELGQLAHALDDMAEALERRQAQLGTSEAGRYRAERALEESEEVLWLVLEGVRDHAVVLLDDAGRVATWHTGAKRVTGYESGAILGRTLATFFSGEQREHAVDELLRKASHQGSADYEGLLQKADGAPFVASVTITALWEETRLRGFTVVIHDITERQRAEEALRAHGERLQQLSRQLMEIQETERRALARELHDEVGQALTAMKINLQALRRPNAIDAVGERIDDTIGIVDGLLKRVRELSLDLRPSLLDDWGLVAAVRWYVERQGERSGVTTTFETALEDDRFAPDVETTCFRVVQEAITNAIRHARARRIAVELRRDGDGLALAVRDDGAGFDVAIARHAASQGRSLGILGMEERVRLLGGEFTIDSAPARGTTIRAAVPLASSTTTRANLRAS